MKGRRTKLSGMSWYILLAAVVASGLLLSYLLYSGPNLWYDDSTYIYLANQLLQGNPAVFGSRFGFGFLKLFPLAASFGAFGYGAIQAILPSIVEFVLLVLLTFLIGKKIGGSRLGLLAAFFASTAPFVVANVSRVLPDIPTGLTVAVAAYLFIDSLGTRHTVVLPFLAGLSSVLPIYMNDEGFAVMFFIWLFIISLFLFPRIRKLLGHGDGRARPKTENSISSRYVLLALAGAALGTVAYALPFYIFFKQPLFFLLRYDINYSLTNPLLVALLLSLPSCIGNSCLSSDIYSLGPLVVLAVLGSAAVLNSNPNRKSSFVIFLNWSVFLFLIFGTTHLSLPYLPIPVVSRFFTVVLPLLSVLSAIALWRLYDYLKTRHLRTLAPIALLAALILVIAAYLPMYGVLRSNNEAILNTTQTAYRIGAFFINESSAGPVDVYAHAYDGFNFLAPEVVMFATGFDSNISVYQAANASMAGPSYGVLNCSLQPGRRSFLAVMYGSDAESAREQVAAEVGSWLGSTCTSTFVKQIDQTYIYSLSNATQ